MKSKKPNFFIAGAPKCGTTALCNYLNQHPDIFIPNRKEPCFFGSDLHKNPECFSKLSEEDYLSLFGDAHQNRIGEGTTAYFYSKVAAKELKEFNPDASVIIMIRNPIDLVYSLHSQLLFQGEEDRKYFADALYAEKARKSGAEIPKRYSVLETLFYSEIAKCYTNIRRYLDVFGSDKVHIIIFEDFTSDVENTIKGVFEFLGVDSSFVPHTRIFNENKKIRNQTVHNLLYNPPEIATKVLNTIMPKSFIQNIFVVIRNLNAKSEVRQPIDADLRRRLNRQYEHEVKKLGKLLQRDLTHWITEL